MEKIDFKKTYKEIYSAKKEFRIVNVPKMQFIKIDGMGDPNKSDYGEAISWLYSIAYPIKFFSKGELKKDYVVPPLESLWWAEDMTAFQKKQKNKWKWCCMLMQPDWITKKVFSMYAKKAEEKHDAHAPESLRLETLSEDLSVQVLHIGPYDEEAQIIEKLHTEFMPENMLIENGYHHEIYLSDPRKVTPDKLKTIIRQPVKKQK